MFREYDKVRTLVDREGISAGSIGIIVSFYSTGPACEVEIWNDNGYPVDVVTYTFDEIKLVNIE